MGFGGALRRTSIDNSGPSTHREIRTNLHFRDEFSSLAVTDSCLVTFETISWVLGSTLNHENIRFRDDFGGPIDNSGSSTHRVFSSTLHFRDEFSILALTDL